MANKENGNNKLSKWDKVVAWYAGHSYAVGIIYSAGASVVIIGALFKIMHWPGAGIILTLGMCTEAFLFILGIFEKPHAVYNWENYFPKLIGHDSAPFAELLAGNAASGASNASVSAIDEKDAKALKESIANVAATANTLANLGKLAEGSQKLSEKLNAAAAATDQFAGAQAGVANSVETLGNHYAAAAKASEALKAGIDAAAKEQESVKGNIAALNAAYELNLKAVQAGAAELQAASKQIEGLTKQAEGAAKSAEEAAKSAEAYAAAQAKLAKQVADLNNVYGGMLNALA